MDWKNLETFSFGDSPELADELAALVLAGFKRATCSAAAAEVPPTPGTMTVMLDGSGHPRAIIKTVEVFKCRFNEVSPEFAFAEGEGDRTLAYWRNAHQRYFSRLGQFSEDMLLYCERFDVVESIDDPPKLAPAPKP